ncbi:AI-2E family transporter [Anaerocolumna chitinilytica]|uniref:AI-2E family transporter n=1 Tax=Anaerocolumna chitinilytica TaxID=1727145 RepID=A0A7I8DXZ4_9FIRM|nr:AI-2E family transporter [Anaerocolumna chitinilytica]BCK01117.1 AI-2E family transporter [Anaerocolumna chitinilytica]
MKISNKMNKQYTLIAIYVIITCSIIYILSLVAKNASGIIAELMQMLKWLLRVAKPVAIAFILAYLLDPVVNFFENLYEKIRIKKWQLKSGRTLAVLTTVILFLAVIVLAISLLVYNVTNQLRLAKVDDIVILATNYINNISDFYNSVLDKLEKVNIHSDQINAYVRDNLTNVISALRNGGYSFVNSLSNISSYITTLIFALVISIYFMIDGKMIKNYIRKVGKAFLSVKWNTRISIFLKDADYIFSGYIRGQLIDVFVMMCMLTVVLSLIGVKYAILIGIFAGLGNLIPYLGPIIAYVTTALSCLAFGEYKKLIIAVIVLVIVQALDGNVIAPKLLSQSIKIHPVLVIISLIFGNAIGGLFGMLFAVPVGALIKLLFSRYVDTRLKEKQEAQEDMIKKKDYESTIV